MLYRVYGMVEIGTPLISGIHHRHISIILSAAGHGHALRCDKHIEHIVRYVWLFFSAYVAYPRHGISLRAASLATDWFGLLRAQRGVTRNEHEQKNAYGLSHVQIVVRIKILMVRRFVSYGDVL